jgi:uncharacterized protein YkwD
MGKQWIVLGALMVALAGCGGGGGASAVSDGSEGIANPDPIDAPELSESEKEAYLEAINDARSQQQDCGEEGSYGPADPLEWSDELYKAAYEHDRDMVETDMVPLSHDGSGTEYDYTARVQGLEHSTFRDRIENNGYTGWRRIGENIAAGTTMDTARKAVEAWLESDGHCANLMNPDYKEVGMAHVEKEGAHYTHYWTQDFGAK